jgi:multiple antibiotic resistance protein
MSPLLIKISKDFATLWTTIDPIGNVALFAGLTAALTRSERHRTALRAAYPSAESVLANERRIAETF